MGKEGGQQCGEQKPPLAAPEERRLCQRPTSSMGQVEESDTVATLILTRAQHRASAPGYEALGEGRPQR